MIVLPTGASNALALLSIATYHTCAPVNASCTGPELREDALRLNAKAVITTRDAEERLELQALRNELNCDVVFVEERSSGPPGLFDMSVMGDEDDSIKKPSQPHGLTDQSLVLHTSGTSGKKKVVPYTLRSLIVGTWAVVHSWDLRSTDVNMNMMPLFHVGGIVRNLLAPILSGGSAIMCSGFDAIAFWNLSAQMKATWYYAAPTIHHAILNSQPENIVPQRDLQIRMICNAAGGLLPSLAGDVKERFGNAVILPSYGMTECMPIASPPTTYQLERPGCSGIACGPYLSIRDSSNIEHELPRGKTGAVSVRGLPTFAGYEVSPDINVPLDTSAFSSEGWFDSGDMGYMDDDGYLFITGRSKEIINKGGEVISPFEVEEAIITAARDYVKTTLAFAIDHDVLQEAIGVVIVPVPGRPVIGLAQLLDLLKEHLHPSKWPFAVVYMQDLPKNSAGKPLRIKLAQRLNLGCMSDSVPALARHFEAVVPTPTAALSDPISCTSVQLDLRVTSQILADIEGIDNVAVRSRHDGAPEAFVSVESQVNLDSNKIKSSLASFLPGYAIPDIHVLNRSLPMIDGNFDFASMESDIIQQNTASMSANAAVVRDIVAGLLDIEPGMISGDSDFFLLGGNSLLLGKLSYLIRKRSNASIAVAAIFTNSTINGIASLIDVEQRKLSLESLVDENVHLYANTGNNSELTLGYNNNGSPMSEGRKERGQNHPLNLIVQAIPMVFFYPLKTAVTWSILLFILSYLAPAINQDYWQRMLALICAIVVARLCVRACAPVAAIAFKWIVIGKYKPGNHKMWSFYYLRWWLVNQSLVSAGRGIFAMHPELSKLYYRLLGAHIGKDVSISKHAHLGEFDLLTLEDGCRIDSSLIRGFCVEREGYFRLTPIVIGRRAIVNSYTQISPGAVIPEGSVYGPHASSHESPSPPSYAAYNRTLFMEPHCLLKFFVAWPIIVAVTFVSYIPWFIILWLMVSKTTIVEPGSANALVSVVYWFSNAERVLWHAVSRMVRAICTPLLQVFLGIIAKRILGLNGEGQASDATQLVLLRKYINSTLLSQSKLKEAFSLIGTHYEGVSFIYRIMGAKIGRRVYWPGSGIYCLDPELLEIGDDVVFGSRSEVYTTDRIGSEKIRIGNGAMIADRVVLLPGVTIGSRAVMGSGALSKRNASYEDGSTWMGNDRGEAICFNKGSPSSAGGNTITPFGRAFYKREANYFVWPYFLILAINLIVTACSAAYWSISAVVAAQLLHQCYFYLPHFILFQDHWYRFGILYGIISASFVVVLNIQALLCVLWVLLTKWIVIGQRKPGPCAWDESDYCQRWQLHLVLSRPLYKGYGIGGVLAPITGSAYIIWFFRAMGAKIGSNCSLYPGGKQGLMTEPDLVEIGNNVSLDNCSVVAHINSRGNFALNPLKIGSGCAMRTGSRLLSGASMEDNSMLCEHTLLTSGEVAEADSVYVGWPAKRLDDLEKQRKFDDERTMFFTSPPASTNTCPICHKSSRKVTVAACGHYTCDSCIPRSRPGKCPDCTDSISSPSSIIKFQPSFPSQN
ncbi:AMP-dependent synthetase and ligase [Lentinula aciculospora]|uniref:AMP-dependent synthetase and ligase n=1 Tax=Lentinula aciculospora TaxID=153920 RepID=A0A9W9A678_9AGAR|nr:AMP-dependent synthetase and ligase [Lentinula aciculospora]